jgi:hypothetical protein
MAFVVDMWVLAHSTNLVLCVSSRRMRVFPMVMISSKAVVVLQIVVDVAVLIIRIAIICSSHPIIQLPAYHNPYHYQAPPDEVADEVEQTYH